MRILSFFFLLISSTVQAAVIDFENATAVEACDYTGCGYNTVITPEGFVFDTAGTEGLWLSESVISSTASYAGIDGNYLTTSSIYQPGGNLGGPAGIDVAFRHESGQAFDLNSMDVYLFDDDVSELQGAHVITPLEIIGYDNVGTVVASRTITPSGVSDADEWVNVVFGDDWNSVHSVYIQHQALVINIFGGSYEPLNPRIDNVSANVVPIPAAVWLFGSALAGLGWMRRKQAV